MILRRVISHVQDQNWTAIVIDLMIVVLGVFLGIQIGNWNEARKNEARGNFHLERILDDLSSDTTTVNRTLIFNADVLDYGAKALYYLEDSRGQQQDSWETVLAFFQASQLFPFAQNNGTYEELRSVGELGLIENRVLRARLAEYYISGGVVRADYVLKQVPDYRTTIRGLVPSVLTAYVWESCHVSDKLNGQYLIDCDAPLTDEQLQAVLADIEANPNVLPQLRDWMSTLEVIQGLLDVLGDSADDLITEIETELNR